VMPNVHPSESTQGAASSSRRRAACGRAATMEHGRGSSRTPRRARSSRSPARDGGSAAMRCGLPEGKGRT